MIGPKVVPPTKAKERDAYEIATFVIACWHQPSCQLAAGRGPFTQNAIRPTQVEGPSLKSQSPFSSTGSRPPRTNVAGALKPMSSGRQLLPRANCLESHYVRTRRDLQSDRQPYYRHVAESWASSPHARRSMQGNRSTNTSPEVAVRTLLHARGLRYRTHFRPVPSIRRTADIVFTRRKIAVFIDGCFWHACPEHFSAPRSNVDYWVPKIERNQRRDCETNEALRAEGWTVLRFWEHESPTNVAECIEHAMADWDLTPKPPARRAAGRRGRSKVERETSMATSG